jgi:dTDP-4-amino-4,6-dideoxygalactose transaminase
MQTWKINMEKKCIKLVDLQKQYLTISEEIDNKVLEVIKSGQFILGKENENFQNSYNKLMNFKYGYTVSNGTAALMLSIKALNLKKDDEVITVSNTFIATTEAISFTGAKPVFVDINLDDFTIDVSKIEEKITKNTKAIIAVHIHGMPCEMDEIKNICKKYNLFLIEDCAQAHLAEYKNKKVGSFGDFGCFSFYPGKNLGSYGDGGYINTDNKKYSNLVNKLRNHGRLDKYSHDIEGYNFRLNEVQAGILNVKLKYLKEWTKKRIENGNYYKKNLNDIDVITFSKDFDYKNPVYHLFVCMIKDKKIKRDDVVLKLKEKGIEVGVHYPIPLHLQKAYKYLNYKKGSLKNTEYFSENCFSLPIYPELTKQEIEYICENLKKVLKK